MARKKLEPAQEVVVADLHRTPKHVADQESKVRERQAVVLEQFGEGLEYNRDHYVAEIRRDMARTVEAALAIGRKLIVMREMESHGDWLQCLAQTGLGEDTGQRMMAAARRMDALPNSATSRNLAIASGNQSKLFELMTLDDDQFKALASGDEAAGLTLDDVERLTVKELRKALREAKADLQAKDKVLGDKEAAITRRDTTIAKLKRSSAKATPDELTADLRKELEGEAFGLECSIVADDGVATSLLTRVRALHEHAEQHGQDHTVYLAGIFARLERALHVVRDQFGIPHIAVGDPALEAQMTLGQEN